MTEKELKNENTDASESDRMGLFKGGTFKLYQEECWLKPYNENALFFSGKKRWTRDCFNQGSTNQAYLKTLAVMFRNNNIIDPFMEKSKASVWWRNAAKTSRLFSLFYVIKRSALAFVKPIKLHYMQYNASIQTKMLKSEKRYNSAASFVCFGSYWRALDEVYCEKKNKKNMKQDRTSQGFSFFERGRRGRWRREAREGTRKADLLQVVKKKKVLW